MLADLDQQVSFLIPTVFSVSYQIQDGLLLVANRVATPSNSPYKWVTVVMSYNPYKWS